MKNGRHHVLKRAIAKMSEDVEYDYAVKGQSAMIVSIELIRLTTLRCLQGQGLWLAVPHFDF